MAVRGVVQRTFQRDFDGKILYSFTLKGQDGFFGTGTKKAPVEVGKSYEFEVDVDGRGRKTVNLATIKPWESGEAIQSPNVSSFAARSRYAGGASKDQGKDDYWRNKEARDLVNDRHRELGATRNTAIALVSLMLTNGAIKLPAKESSKEEVIYKLFEHYTEELLKTKEAPEAGRPDSESVSEASTDAMQDASDADSWK